MQLIQEISTRCVARVYCVEFGPESYVVNYCIVGYFQAQPILEN